MHNQLLKSGPYIAAPILWIIAVYFLTANSNPDINWLLAWAQWDAKWYHEIWQHWYPTADPRALVFPPGFSVTVGALSSILNTPFFLTASIMNVICFVAGNYLCAQTLAAHTNISPARLYTFLFTSPVAYFAFVPYSDSLFYLIFWLVLFLELSPVRTRKFQFAKPVLLLLAPWIRITGYTFFAWLFVKRNYAAIVLASLAGWLTLNYYIAGDHFYFLKAQVLFSMPPGWFLDGLILILRNTFVVNDGTTAIFHHLQFYLLPLFYFVALLATSFWLAYKKDWFLAITLLSLLFISHNQAFWRSTLRYCMPLIPFIAAYALAHIEQLPFSFKKRLLILFFVLFWGSQFYLQIQFANVFRTGSWAY